MSRVLSQQIKFIELMESALHEQTQVKVTPSLITFKSAHHPASSAFFNEMMHMRNMWRHYGGCAYAYI